jgi:MoaA/NifB/PqqE/SkfB family radical SAM enzyme
MGPTGERFRVLQLHPTRRCNLRCLHCYSSSAPEERGELDAALLREALTDAAGEGYNVAGFSGGESILYKELPSVLDHAHACGFTTTVTSNGMLLDERHIEDLRGRADVLAISIDGVPESHNRVRASSRAFDAMASHLEGVRASGINFGFIFTLTQYNLDELEWVADFAVKQGAKLLQIHPLEVVGRAIEGMPDSRPDETECAYAYFAARRLQEQFAGRISVQLDLAHRELVRENPGSVFAQEYDSRELDCRLGDLISPLVIETDGTIVPIGYGFAREYSLGSLKLGRLRDFAAVWRPKIYPKLRQLFREVFEEETSPREFPCFNWYESVARRAVAAAPPVPALVQIHSS